MNADARTASASTQLSSSIRRWREEWGIWEGFVFLVAVVLYARTFGFGWVYDDQLDVVRNTYVQSFSYLTQIFSSTVWAGSGMETYLYRPLALVTYQLNYAISGLEPWSYHVVNVALHALATVLVLRLGRLWGLSPVAAGLGALIFAVHPVHVEVVAAVFGRKDLLAAVCVLWMLLSHRTALARGGWRLLLPVFAYAGAMLSKEVGVIALVLVAAQDWFLEPAGQRGALLQSRRLGLLYLSYLLTLSAYLIVRATVVGGLGIPETFFVDNPLVTAPWSTRVLTALAVVGRGVAVLIAPVTLSPDYSYNVIPLAESLLDGRVLATIALLLASVGAAFRARARHIVVPLSITWYIVTLLPGSNLTVLIGTIFAERLLYLPSVAFSLLVGLALVAAARRFSQTMTFAAAALCLAFAAQTIRYSSAWTAELSLFQWAVASVPESSKAHHKLGEELLRDARLGDAIRELRRAIEIAPANEYAATTLGIAEQHVITRYAGAESVAPPADADVLYVLGKRNREAGSLEAARRYWDSAIDADSTHGESLAALGVLHLVQSDTAGALAYLERALRHKPSLANAWLARGRISLARRDRQGATKALRRFVDVAGPLHAAQVAWAEQVIGMPGR
jgi:Flp pilus assembly protein TadD